MTNLRTDKHDPTEHCSWAHCYTHHVDEHAERSYIACLECGHLYRTSHTLWWAYQRSWCGPRATGAPYWVWMLERLRALWRRPSRIYFCPECLHDF